MNPLKRPLKIAFCMPGKTFSNHFLNSWSYLLSYCLNHNITPYIITKTNSNVYYVRNQCLGADLTRGPNQNPWNGKLDYDFIMWIDSDQVFKVEDFINLLKFDKDIISGLYLMDGGHMYATVQDWDIEYFQKNGSFKFITPEYLKQWKKEHPNSLMKASYSGFGWMLIKRGVFEKMKYPWFSPEWHKFTNGWVDFSSEDASFCLKAKEAGFDILIHPDVIVGHEKSIIY